MIFTKIKNKKLDFAGKIDTHEHDPSNKLTNCYSPKKKKNQVNSLLTQKKEVNSLLYDPTLCFIHGPPHYDLGLHFPIIASFHQLMKKFSWPKIVTMMLSAF